MMQQKPKLTERIQQLKKQKKRYLRREDIPQRDRIYREQRFLHAEESTARQLAHGFASFLREKTILIQPEDLLAGFAYHYSYNEGFPGDGPEDFDPAIKSIFHMDMKREIEEVVRMAAEEERDAVRIEMEQFADLVERWEVKHWHSGHFLADYEGLLQIGFPGILEQEKEYLEKAESKEQRDMLETSILVTEACLDYIARYEVLARQQKHQSEEMQEIEKSLHRLTVGAPKTFRDAIQLVWLAQEMAICESYPSAISFGRFDQYLYPFYQRDMKRGILTEEEAFELVCAFWIKLSNCRKGYQNLTIGGCDEAGHSSANELTYMSMWATELLRFDQPSLAYRCSDNMSEEEWEHILRLIRAGMGFPALFSDRNCMRAKAAVGIAAEDLWNYAFIGCVEMAIPGKEYCETEIARINLPVLVTKAMEQCCKTGSDRVFDVLYSTFLTILERRLELVLHCIDRIDQMYGKCFPLPYLSTLMQGCLEKGSDVMRGGAIYNNSAVNLCGLATAVDSLMAIRYAVYEEKILTMEELLEQVERNHPDEGIRQYLMKRCPKFADGNREADALAADLTRQFAECIAAEQNPRGGRYSVGFYTVEDHAIMGETSGATPDGRHAGEAYSNSCSPSQGRDTKGPTAVIQAVTGLPLDMASNGMVLDLRFSPSYLQMPSHQRALRSLLECYFQAGGLEVQISVVSPETLRAAQLEPEKYEDLIVRVSGFSAYFTMLRKATQDEIIRRTECTI